jgi:hypothetical protein
MDAINVTIRATDRQLRIRVEQRHNDLLVAQLGPTMFGDRRSLPCMLEGLAVWFQQRLCVVLYAASEAIASSTGLVDDLGCGLSTLHFIVDAEIGPQRARCRRLRRRTRAANVTRDDIEC